VGEFSFNIWKMEESLTPFLLISGWGFGVSGASSDVNRQGKRSRGTEIVTGDWRCGWQRWRSCGYGNIISLKDEGEETHLASLDVFFS
jgi:hypothetical protein